MKYKYLVYLFITFVFLLNLALITVGLYPYFPFLLNFSNLAIAIFSSEGAIASFAYATVTIVLALAGIPNLAFLSKNQLFWPTINLFSQILSSIIMMTLLATGTMMPPILLLVVPILLFMGTILLAYYVNQIFPPLPPVMNGNVNTGLIETFVEQEKEEMSADAILNTNLNILEKLNHPDYKALQEESYSYQCPITLTLPTDPVHAISKKNSSKALFEHKAIQRYINEQETKKQAELNEGKITELTPIENPLTKRPITKNDLKHEILVLKNTQGQWVHPLNDNQLIDEKHPLYSKISPIGTITLKALLNEYYERVENTVTHALALTTTQIPSTLPPSPFSDNTSNGIDGWKEKAKQTPEDLQAWKTKWLKEAAAQQEEKPVKNNLNTSNELPQKTLTFVRTNPREYP